ncbi:DUF3048 domain-containing protein [Candidatus Saccharibacteria bacterium]|nr:DUF3048 domain-containing protein [Candidatus Saccharibacteria bacterium]
MTDTKKDFQSHFSSPTIPAPPLHGQFNDSPNLEQKSTKPTGRKKESPSLSKWFMRLSKKKRIIFVASVTAIIVLLCFLSWWFIFRSTEAEEPAPAAVEEPAPPPTTEASKLTGLQVGFDINKRPVTAIMVENSPEARPQSGLSEAGVVYEAVAEGGITRFMALFQDNLPAKVGPVRSVRPYYLDYLVPYGAAIAHVGGSGQALAEIRNEGIRDLDQFSNSGPYWRDSARYAPHNMYTAVNQLLDLQTQKSFGPTDYTSLVRGAEDKPSETPNARTISISMSRSLYQAGYTYDPTTNSYLRTLASQPHIDANTGLQLAPKVVITPIVPRSQSGIYSVYGVNGSGAGLVFQNGTVSSVTWKKDNRADQIRFFDAEGNPFKLVAGQTWITLAASATDVTYAP